MVSKIRGMKHEGMVKGAVLKNLATVLGISFALGSVGAPISELFYEEVNAATQFSDDAKIRDYSREAVESLISAGSIKGYPEDNTFRPQGTITRLEFLSMCVNACDPSGAKIQAALVEAKDPSYDPSGVTFYQDTVEDLKVSWGQDLIVGAEWLGVGTGFEDDGSGKDLWLQPIKRHEAAAIMSDCISKIKGETVPQNYNDYDLMNMIGDWEDVSLSRNAYDVYEMYMMGIAQGDQNGVYSPQANLTREDSAVLINKIINPSKRDTSGVIMMEHEDPYAGIETGTLNQSDANRRSAVPGDTFIASDGKSYTVTEGKGGVLGEGQPIALDAGRYQGNSKEIIEDGVSSDGSFYRLGARYYINPATGEGHWSDEWDAIQEAYYPTEAGSYNGEIRTFGLGGWCKYEWIEAAQAWSCWDYNGFSN